MQKKKMLINMYVVVVNKLYKKELFTDDIMFEPGVWFEDVLFSHKLVPKLNKISFVDEAFYEYIQNTSSITYTYSEKLKDINVVLDKVVEYYRENGLYDLYHDELEYMYARYMLATFVKRLSKSKDKKRFNDGVDYALEKVRSAFPNYKKNKYFTKDKDGNKIIINEAERFNIKNSKKIREYYQISSNITCFELDKGFDDFYVPNFIGIQILSMSKRIMNEVMCLAEDLNIPIYYQDTDSAHLPKKYLTKL